MTRTTTIRLENQYLKFSAAHFTIFSKTERERLHGHNFLVRANITAVVGENGLCFDYNIMKQLLHALCKRLDEYTLLPGKSPYLDIQSQQDEIAIVFDHRTLRLPAEDCLILPVVNITAEELSHWLLERLLRDELAIEHNISALSIEVASGAGQSGSTHWQHGKGIL